MSDRDPADETDAKARRALVDLARAMLSGELPFMEGAVQVLKLRRHISGVADDDEDFATFVLISSETDHLPLAHVRPLWHPETYARLDQEEKRTQEWASTFAPEACRNLITRFGSYTR